MTNQGIDTVNQIRKDSEYYPSKDQTDGRKSQEQGNGTFNFSDKTKWYKLDQYFFIMTTKAIPAPTKKGWLATNIVLQIETTVSQ